MLKQWPTLYVKERSSVIRESVPCRTSAACTRESLVHTLAKVSTYITYITTKYNDKQSFIISNWQLNSISYYKSTNKIDNNDSEYICISYLNIHLYWNKKIITSLYILFILKIIIYILFTYKKIVKSRHKTSFVH